MKPSLLFYCQHSVGMGHLARSFALARALRDSFDLTLVCGGEIPTGIPTPEGIRIEALPPVDASGAGTRRDRLLALERQLEPDALLIELFPFGRKKFANELLPLLKQARRRAAPPLIACSLRDILVAGRRGQAHHDNRAAWLSNRYFDRVLIHADPQLARLEDSFAPRRPLLRTPVHYTGYVAPPVVAAASPRGRFIVVSAGGGLVGMPLFTRVLAAHALLARGLRRPLRIIAGPFLPETDYAALQLRVQEFPDVELLRVVPDLAAQMRSAAASISQCGYNTAMDIAASATPALVVPFVTDTETEQLQRARRLQELGVLDYIDLRVSDDVQLAARMQALGATTPTATRLDLDGARASARLLREWCAVQRTRGAEHAA
jgi:predicted glycosyltransferase